MNRTRLIIATSLALLAGALPCQYAFAQSSEVKAALGSVQAKSVASVETVESLQSAIVSILDLTSAELTDVLSDAKLGAVIAGSDAGLVASAQSLEKQLTMYQSYSDFLRARVLHANQTVDLLKASAADLGAWRKKVYDPSVRQAFNAVLVLQGNEVLLTAQRRFEKVSADVKKLQLSKGVAANALLPLLQDAQKHLAAAIKYQSDARSLFADEQEQLDALTYDAVPGAPVAIALSRSGAGDFACLPVADAKSRDCQLAFQRNEGGYYLLKAVDGTPLDYAPTEISKVSGKVIRLNQVFPGDLLVGIVFIDSINKAQVFSLAPEPVKPADAVGTASVTDTLVVQPTVQSLIKQELDEINKAYQQDFFVMSKLAAKLLK